MEILKSDIPEKLVNAINQIYKNTRANVVTSDGETDSFHILAGVLQGNTFAPFFFATLLDYAMRKALNGREEELDFKVERRKSRYSPIVVTDTNLPITLPC